MSRNWLTVALGFAYTQEPTRKPVVSFRTVPLGSVSFHDNTVLARFLRIVECLIGASDQLFDGLGSGEFGEAATGGKSDEALRVSGAEFVTSGSDFA